MIDVAIFMGVVYTVIAIFLCIASLYKVNKNGK